MNDKHKMLRRHLLLLVTGLVTLVLPLAESADAVVVGIQNTPADGVVTDFDVFRSLGAGGWTEHSTVFAADGNGALGVSLDTSNADYNAGNNGAGYVWYIPVDDYVTALGETSGSPLQNDWVIRHSAWIAEDVNDPLLNEGDWTDSFKLEFGKAVAGGFTVLSTGAAEVSPNNFTYSNCDLGAATCSTAPQAPLPYPAGNTGHVNSDGWTQLVHQYKIDDFDFSGTNTLEDIAVIRPVLFLGDFTSGEDEQGTLYMDRIIVEIFPDLATANATPLDTTNPGGVPIAGTSAAGDFDADGDIDGADFLKWQREMGDANSLGLWESGFGSSARAVAQAVPEPSTGLLLVLATSLLGSVRDCKRIRFKKYTDTHFAR